MATGMSIFFPYHTIDSNKDGIDNVKISHDKQFLIMESQGYPNHPTCVKSPFKDDGKQHSPVIGFAFDGFPLYGPYESNGVLAKDLEKSTALDVCSGHIDEIRGYHYHVTPGRFPYILGGYAGVVEASNNRELRGAQTGALVDNTQQGENQLDKVITTVRPGTASRGKTHSIEFELQPENGLRLRVPSEKPNWV